MPYCYYVHLGWCHDWAPLILGVVVPPSWFGVGLVLFLVAGFLDKNSRPKAALVVRWSPFILMAVSIGYFLAVESLRK